MNPIEVLNDGKAHHVCLRYNMDGIELDSKTYTHILTIDDRHFTNLEEIKKVVDINTEPEPMYQKMDIVLSPICPERGTLLFKLAKYESEVDEQRGLVCPVCHHLVDNADYWNDEGGVCMRCALGEAEATKA